MSVGVGSTVTDNLSVHFALEYISYSVKVDKATPDSAGIGTYASNSGQFGASVTYRTL